MSFENDACAVAAALDGRPELQQFENVMDVVVRLTEQQEIDSDRIKQLETTITALKAIKN